MFFGSQYVLAAKDSDAVEVIDESEIATGLAAQLAVAPELDDSSSDEGDAPAAAAAAAAAAAPSAARLERKEDDDDLFTTASAEAAPRRGMLSRLSGALFGGSKPKSNKKKKRVRGAAPPSRSRAAAAAAPASSRLPAPRSGPHHIHRRRIDTNILSVELGTLGDRESIATGDPICCQNKDCSAMLSRRSRLLDAEGNVKHGDPLPASTTTVPSAPPAPVAPAAAAAPAAAPAAASLEAVAEEDSTTAAPTTTTTTTGAGAGSGAGASNLNDVTLEEGEFLWECEFCGRKQAVAIDLEELPTSDTVDYIEEVPSAAAAAGVGAGGDTTATDESVVVFCVDVSGSMCVTQEVPGSVKLKGADRSKVDQSARTVGDAHDQFFPGQRRDVTYVSRLQCVQAAVATQIETMKAANPNRKVALVAFSGDVAVYTGGDASDTVVVAGDRLTQYDRLVATGTDLRLNKPVSDTADALCDKVWGLTESGPTALGPAVVVSVAIAARTPGSRVVLATDGLANVGLGSVESSDDPAAVEKATTFYERLADFARSKGVTIDVVGIEGEGCNLEALSVLPDRTSGDLSNVNPMELTKNFSAALAQPVLATNVTTTLILHESLMFRNDDSEEPAPTGQKLVQDVGSVTASSTHTLEYALRPLYNFKAGQEEVPFQLQIRFQKLDGMKLVRNITQWVKVTNDRAVAEANMAADVVRVHAVQQAANLARKGGYHASRVQNHGYNRLLARNLRTDEDRRGYSAWAATAVAVDDALAVEEAEEESLGLRSSGIATEDTTVRAMRKARRGKKDGLSAQLHKMSKASKSIFRR